MHNVGIARPRAMCDCAYHIDRGECSRDRVPQRPRVSRMRGGRPGHRNLCLVESLQSYSCQCQRTLIQTSLDEECSTQASASPPRLLQPSYESCQPGVPMNVLSSGAVPPGEENDQVVECVRWAMVAALVASAFPQSANFVSKI